MAKPPKKEIHIDVTKKVVTCGLCSGRGQVIDENTYEPRPCWPCEGTGKVNK